MADPTNPPPRPPGPWDHEDPPDIRPGFIPKRPKVPVLTPRPLKDGDPVHPDHDDGEPCHACIAEEE